MQNLKRKWVLQLKAGKQIASYLAKKLLVAHSIYIGSII